MRSTELVTRSSPAAGGRRDAAVLAIWAVILWPLALFVRPCRRVRAAGRFPLRVLAAAARRASRQARIAPGRRAAIQNGRQQYAAISHDAPAAGARRPDAHEIGWREDAMHDEAETRARIVGSSTSQPSPCASGGAVSALKGTCGVGCASTRAHGEHAPVDRGAGPAANAGSGVDALGERERLAARSRARLRPGPRKVGHRLRVGASVVGDVQREVERGRVAIEDLGRARTDGLDFGLAGQARPTRLRRCFHAGDRRMELDGIPVGSWTHARRRRRLRRHRDAEVPEAESGRAASTRIQASVVHEKVDVRGNADSDGS